MPTENLMNRICLASPMTGPRDFNYSASDAETTRLHRLGFHVVNPAECNPDGSSWNDCMRRDIAMRHYP